MKVSPAPWRQSELRKNTNVQVHVSLKSRAKGSRLFWRDVGLLWGEDSLRPIVLKNSLEKDNILAMLMLYPVREGEARMRGRQNAAQEQLFYSFQLEDHIPKNHLLRGIDRFLDLSDLHQHLAEFYSHIGRPSVDPELMIRMLIIGYCFGIRSERRLCEEVHLNLAYRWFLSSGS
jgi:hypothetical protein